MEKIWTRCIREEIICVLWIIAALLAHDKSKLLSGFCSFWAISAGVFSFYYGIKEKRLKNSE